MIVFPELFGIDVDFTVGEKKKKDTTLLPKNQVTELLLIQTAYALRESSLGQLPSRDPCSPEQSAFIGKPELERSSPVYNVLIATSLY